MSDKPPEIIDADELETLRELPALVGAEHAPEQTVTQAKAQVNLIQGIMAAIMQEGEHYGTIPGCGDKKTLFKPGADKLATVFRLGLRYEIVLRDLPDGHREYQIIAKLFHIPTGRDVGEGVGTCTTLETKYRYRTQGRHCPSCQAEAIIPSKFGSHGWHCFKAKGGCGENFPHGHELIEGQETGGRAENPDIADTYNTVLKMAKKRAQIDAILCATAASDIFQQSRNQSDLTAAQDADAAIANGHAPKGQGNNGGVKIPPRKPAQRKPPQRPNRQPRATPDQRAANSEKPKSKDVVKDLKTRVVEVRKHTNKDTGVLRWGLNLANGVWVRCYDENLSEVARDAKGGIVISYHFCETEGKYLIDDIRDDIAPEPMPAGDIDSAFDTAMPGRNPRGNQ